MSDTGHILQDNVPRPHTFPWHRYAIAFLIAQSIALFSQLPAFLSMVGEGVRCLLGGGNSACNLSSIEGVLFAGGNPMPLAVGGLLGAICTLVLIVHRVVCAFRHVGADKPRAQQGAFPWRFYALAFVFIYIMMVSPAIASGLAGGAGDLIGCTVDFISAGSCKAFGHDWGGLLSNIYSMGWYIIITSIAGVMLSNLLCLVALIHLAYRTFHRARAA